MNILDCTPQQWQENENDWLELLENSTNWDKIPLLNVNELHNLKDLRLVKFRAMIQDMHGPEYYVEKYEVINVETQQTHTKSGKYLDIADCKSNEILNLEGPSTVRNERQTYVAISVPALNEWVQKTEEEQFKLKIEESNPGSASRQSNKRHLNGEEAPMEIDGESRENPEASNKKQCSQVPESAENNIVSREYLLNFPIPDSSGKVCHLKVYQNCDSLKLNSLCEFVGFLSADPTLALNNGEDEEIEAQIHNPPPSLIPRIHCVAFKHMTHNNPLLINGGIALDRLNFIRKEFLILLTQLLFGDELAAEYLIYHLISEVYLRKDFMAIGKFALNISNVPQIENFDYVQELYKFIEILTTKSHYLAMSLENMNEMTFIPKKDYTSNRLSSSLLQLSPNTHLILDETKLSAGKLNATGVNGVKALATAIKNQRTVYDFTYYQMDFDCDIPFLILSEGKSMLPSDCHVVLQPEESHLNTVNEIFEAARHFLKPELLREIRIYLTQTRMTKYEISDNIQELVQNEFVNMRQRGNVSGDDLHNLLVLARLICISQGKNTLDEECWKKACTLEKVRKERIKK